MEVNFRFILFYFVRLIPHLKIKTNKNKQQKDASFCTGNLV